MFYVILFVVCYNFICHVLSLKVFHKVAVLRENDDSIVEIPRARVGGGGVAGYMLLAFQNPYPIIVYSVANYRPHLSHFWANVIVILSGKFNVSQLLNIKKEPTRTIFQPRIFPFLNPCLPEFSYPRNPENVRPHSSNSTKNVTPL